MDKPLAGLVEVRLTVDRLRHQIMAFLPEHSETIRASIEQAVENAVDRFDWLGEVKKVTESVIRETISREIRRAVENVAWDAELKKKMQETVVDAIRDQLGNRS